MQIAKRVEYVWSDKQARYIPIRRLSINWTGPLAFCKGPSAQQEQLANSQQGFYNTLTNDYSQQFGNQSAILSSLNNTLSPIVAAGPNQFGYSAAETNSLNSSALQNTGQQYANASQALKANQAATGGGNVPLPSGVQSQQQAGLASSAANQASNQLLGIQQSGYQQGYNTFESAVGQLGGVAGQYNPTGYAGSATGAGSAAANTANQVTQLNNAASPWNLVGGLLGGATSGIAGGLTGDLGTAVSGMGSGNWGW
jgi:hypothetical protein